MTAEAILYLDADVVAVNKPSGLLVHRTRIDSQATEFALQQVRGLVGQRVYPVHRLDKPTSGVLLFALHPEAARELALTFAEGRVVKRYQAVVRGYTDDEGTIDHALSLPVDPLAGLRGEIGAPKPATTHYRTLGRAELPVHVDRYPTSRYSLVEATPVTGRTHQLRRHFKHIAHPIIGDRKYGKNSHNNLFVERFGSRRLLLHATSIAFPHPSGGQRLIEAPVRGVMREVLTALGWEDHAPGGPARQPGAVE